MSFAAMYILPLSIGALLLWANSVLRESGYGLQAGLISVLMTIVCTAAAQILIGVIRSMTGTNRDRLIAMYKPLLTVVQTATVIVTLGFGISLAAFFYYFPALLIGSPLPNLSFVLGALAAYITVRICKLILVSKPDPLMDVVGIPVDRSEAPQLWSMVEDIAEKFGTVAPERIVLTLDNKICITEASIKANGCMFGGRSLILSIPIVKYLSEGQCRAVIAHELAHFVRGDTKFVLRSFPIFQGSLAARSIIARAFLRFEMIAAAGLSGLYLLKSFIDSFRRVESQISRSSEIAADAKAASVTGSNHLAEALVAVHGLAYSWDKCESTFLNYPEEHRALVINIVNFFEYVLPTLDAQEITQAISSRSTPHPLNSHPTLQLRIDQLGEKADIAAGVSSFLRAGKNAAIISIENLEEIERRLSDSFRQDSENPRKRAA